MRLRNRSENEGMRFGDLIAHTQPLTIAPKATGRPIWLDFEWRECQYSVQPVHEATPEERTLSAAGVLTYSDRVLPRLRQG